MTSEKIHEGVGKIGLKKKDLILNLDPSKFKSGKAKLVLVAIKDGVEISKKEIEIVLDIPKEGNKISRRGFFKFIGAASATTAGGAAIFKSLGKKRNKGEEEQKQAEEIEKPTPRIEQSLTVRQHRILSKYVNQFNIEEHNPETINRTFEHRLEDHEILLTALLNPDSNPKFYAFNDSFKELLEQNKDSLESLRIVLFLKSQKIFFIDIGPGIANNDMPAITSQEIAERFPDMIVAALDLPSEMDRFTGISEDKSYMVSAGKRTALLNHKNIHLIRGDGLKSLLEQWNKQSANPYPERTRPAINDNTTIIIRAANSIDIYCDWKDVSPAIDRIAYDFKFNSVILLFNREILIKKPYRMKWSIAGRVSSMGFNHSSRMLTRNGEHPFELYEEAVKNRYEF